MPDAMLAGVYVIPSAAQKVVHKVFDNRAGLDAEP